MRFRFTPALEQLGDRVNPSTLATAPLDAWDYTPTMTRQITIVQDLCEDGARRTTLEGQECLVFFLGGIPSAQPADMPQRRNLVTLHSADYSGTHILYQDVVIPQADPYVFALDARASGM